MTMNDEIKKYPTYALASTGMLFRCPSIKSTDDYNHQTHQLHHYIPKSSYARSAKWYKQHGIEQRLILVSIPLHEQIHNQAIKNLTDEEFEQKYKISRYELLFSKKRSNY